MHHAMIRLIESDHHQAIFESIRGAPTSRLAPCPVVAVAARVVAVATGVAPVQEITMVAVAPGVAEESVSSRVASESESSRVDPMVVAVAARVGIHLEVARLVAAVETQCAASRIPTLQALRC